MNNGGKFEEAVRELERIVEELESGNVSLDRSVELYNRGRELHKYCDGIIKDIALKIESLDGEKLGE
ncbi:exodeoxyribonuclease VII small subunit [Anaplasma capra]|nr:exodeoxyribonuclease VII small subunit [Anaplasma capra]MCU7612486.1 exodeoxyribonuclease VII small subunit [Anaplasma capra]